MNPFEMVVLIVAIVMITSVFRAKYRGNGRGGKAVQETSVEAQRLRHEVAALKDRVAVLERLVTDESGPRALEREIEALRSRDA